MKDFKIAVLEPEGYSLAAQQLVADHAALTFGPVTRAQLMKWASQYDGFIIRLGHKIDDEVLASAKRLKVIVSATTGLDHIDLQLSAAKHIDVLSLRGEVEFLESITATAELTWGLLLSVMRKIPAANAHVLEGGWDRDRFKGLDLSGRRLGIVGLGRLGRQVARYGNVFGMTVAAYDPSPRKREPGVEMVATLKSLASQSDILTVHAPLSAETVSLISAEVLSALPVGAIIINTARGRILDEGALLEGLESGHLGGAGLDVLGEEPPRHTTKALIEYAKSHKNLIISPHIGGATHDAMAKTEVFMAQKLVRWMEQNKK